MWRAANGGGALPAAAADALIGRQIMIERGERMHRTVDGRTMLARLMAVTQAYRLKLEKALVPSELAQLRALLQTLHALSGEAGELAGRQDGDEARIASPSRARP